jgi:hypothetical protein
MTAHKVCSVIDQAESQNHPTTFNETLQCWGGDMSNGLGIDTRSQVDTHELYTRHSFIYFVRNI